MASKYPPAKAETAIYVFGLYERYLIQLQEQELSPKVDDEIKIKKGDTFRYLTESTWSDGLNKLDCRCMFCLEQVLESEDIVHTKCACKPLPVIHARCLLELKQYGERTVNGQESNKPTNEERKFQPSFVVKCSLCTTPFLGKTMLNLFYEGLQILQKCDPRQNCDAQTTAEDELNDVTAKGKLLLVGIMKVQNVLKSILTRDSLTSWHTSSDCNSTLGKVFKLLSQMHVVYSNLVLSEYNVHSFAGRMCMIAAIHTYGPGMTVWGVNTVKFLLEVCKVCAKTSVLDPIDIDSQRHAVPEIIRYVNRVVKSAPEAWQVDLHQEACKDFFTSLTELAQDDVFRKEWLLPCFPNSEIEVAGEKKIGQPGSGGSFTSILLLLRGGSGYDRKCVGGGGGSNAVDDEGLGEDDGSTSGGDKKVEEFENDLERQSGVNTSSAKEDMSGGEARFQSSHETHSRVHVIGEGVGGGGSSAFDAGLGGDDGSTSAGGVTLTTGNKKAEELEKEVEKDTSGKMTISEVQEVMKMLAEIKNGTHNMYQ